MKKGLLYLGMMAICMVFSFNTLKAQTETDNESVTYTLPEMKELVIYGNAPTLALLTPAGGAVIAGAVAYSGSWLNYTSIVTTGTRKILVKISTAAPEGTELTVEAATPTGTGTVGSKTAAITLAIGDQELITGIGSCNTGTGEFGANLTYNWSVTDIALVRASPVAITATYTITASAL